MFEDSLFESSGKIKSKSKWWTILTLIVNGSILGILILIPMLHPEALPKNRMATLVVAPPPPPPPLPQMQTKVAKIQSEMLDKQIHAPSQIPKNIEKVIESAPPQVASVSGGSGVGGSGVLNSILRSLGTGTPAVRAIPPIKKSVSSGVIAGLVISKVTPVYPTIAKAAHISGTVVVHITISKTGAVENVQVVSGPPMLQNSALDAIRQYRYKPFLLNGEPTEVDGIITVNYVNQ